MILDNLTATPTTDPSSIIGIRDSVYAADLLFAAVGHLDFFTRLGERPMELSSIVSAFGIRSRPASVMLTYFMSLGLVERVADTYTITDQAREHLTATSPWSLAPYISTQLERPIVARMLEVLRTDRPASWGARMDEQEWAKAMERNDFANMFTAGMDSRGAFFAPGLAEAFNFSAYSSVIDIAGASGIYAACIKAKHPSVRAALLERPPVDRIAKEGLERRGMANSIEVHAADMFRDPIPEGFDIHLFSHVIHDWNLEQNRKLVRSSYRSLNRGGIIMIHDAHIERGGVGPLSVAEYSVLLMFSTDGKCYSVDELEELLTGEGFVDIQYFPTVGNRSIVVGRKG